MRLSLRRMVVLILYWQIGKQMTIEFFEESSSDKRGGKLGASSLRFPRIKTAWEEGKRDI